MHELHSYRLKQVSSSLVIAALTYLPILIYCIKPGHVFKTNQ